MSHPIKHAELAEFLMTPGILSTDNCAKARMEILAFTSRGVLPETQNHECATPIEKPRFALGRKSLANLEGVHPKLVAVVKRAIELTTQDFMVFDGLRTMDEQKKLKARGASKTLDSYHLPQADGWGHAVDLVPIIGGIPKWDWQGCAAIAFAVDRAATEMGVADLLTWGGAWDRRLSDFGGTPESYMAEVKAYQKRHLGPDFIDGVHFQIRR